MSLLAPNQRPRFSIRGPRLVLVAALGLLPACSGTTGDELVDFKAAAVGASTGVPGKSFEFTNDRGWNVALTRATLHVGAIYLDTSAPVSGSQGTNCILPGTYVAEVTVGRDVDLLSPLPQPFPTLGHGTTLEALVGQVWLTHGDVNEISDPDPDPILDVEGTATQGGDVRPFVGRITISDNRQETGTALAGAAPICKQRIVSPIATRVTIEQQGGLLLRIDPSQLFVNVDFGSLAKSSDGYAFSDDPNDSDQASVNLYSNLHAAGALFEFSWNQGL